MIPVHRPALWLVLLLAFVQSVLPARVQARAVGADALVQEICAAGGIQSRAFGEAGGDERSSSSGTCDACPLCAAASALPAAVSEGRAEHTPATAQPPAVAFRDERSIAPVIPVATGPPAVS